MGKLASRSFLVIAVIEGLTLLAVSANNLASAKTDILSSSYYSVLYMAAAICFMYFGFEGILRENLIDLVSFLLLTIMVTGFAISQVVHTLGQNPIDIFQLIVAAVAQLLYIPLGWQLYLDYGWSIFVRIGSDSRLRGFFTQYQLFLTFIKFDVMFAIILYMMIAFFLLRHNDYELFLDAGIMFLTFGWLIAGWQMIKKERGRWFYGPFILWGFLFPAYAIGKIVVFQIQYEKYAGVPQAQLITVGVLGIGVRMGVLYFARQCRLNFDKGLRNFLNVVSDRKQVEYV